MNFNFKTSAYILIFTSFLYFTYIYSYKIILIEGEFKHEVRLFQKPYDNQQAEQISLMV